MIYERLPDLKTANYFKQFYATVRESLDVIKRRKEREEND